jgi:hypothetical protein
MYDTRQVSEAESLEVSSQLWGDDSLGSEGSGLLLENLGSQNLGSR